MPVSTCRRNRTPITHPHAALSTLTTMTSESHPQPCLAPSPASVVTAGPATQRHERPPKILAKGPFWARLPALRAMTSAVAASQSQGQSTQPDEGNTSRLSAAPPPIVLPDRVGTARILLSDTQSCVQKLSSRMDALCTRNEQALKEVQLSREALDTSGEKAIAEIADVGTSRSAYMQPLCV